jgi:L-lactate dehydrogenase complex protein LldG
VTTGAGQPASRDLVLGSVRRALDRRPRAAVTAFAARPPRYRRQGSLPRPSVLELFADRCVAYGAVVEAVEPQTIDRAIETACARNGASAVALPPDIPSSWRSSRVEWVECEDAPAEALDRLDGVLSGCAVAIAETGTIVLDGGAWQGRRALTLVPDFHLCVVFADQIVEVVPEAIERLRPAADAGQPITFISGCSATSDIEMHRVEGVHGPRRLAVLVANRDDPTSDPDLCWP